MKRYNSCVMKNYDLPVCLLIDQCPMVDVTKFGSLGTGVYTLAPERHDTRITKATPAHPVVDVVGTPPERTGQVVDPGFVHEFAMHQANGRCHLRDRVSCNPVLHILELMRRCLTHTLQHERKQLLIAIMEPKGNFTDEQMKPFYGYPLIVRQPGAYFMPEQFNHIVRVGAVLLRRMGDDSVVLYRNDAVCMSISGIIQTIGSGGFTKQINETLCVRTKNRKHPDVILLLPDTQDHQICPGYIVVC